MNSDGHKSWEVFTCELGKHSCVARFANRSDAEDHLRFLRKHLPNMKFEIVPDIKENSSRLVHGQPNNH